jgi:hypothetical protein
MALCAEPIGLATPYPHGMVTDRLVTVSSGTGQSGGRLIVGIASDGFRVFSGTRRSAVARFCRSDLWVQVGPPGDG